MNTVLYWNLCLELLCMQLLFACTVYLLQNVWFFFEPILHRLVALPVILWILWQFSRTHVDKIACNGIFSFCPGPNVIWRGQGCSLHVPPTLCVQGSCLGCVGCFLVKGKGHINHFLQNIIHLDCFLFCFYDTIVLKKWKKTRTFDF